MFVFLGAIAIQLAVCWALTPSFGLLGASLGRTSMFLAMFILFVWASSKVLSLSIDKIFLGKALFSSAVMGALVYALALWSGFSLWLTPLYMLIGGAIYFFSCSFLRTIKLDDIRFIFGLLPVGAKILAKMEKVIKTHKMLYGAARALLFA